MFSDNELLNNPLFIGPPKRFISWNAKGKVIWGGDTLEGVLTPDPDGPVRWIAIRTEHYSHDYTLVEVLEN